MYRLVFLSCLSVVYAQLEVAGPCNLTNLPYVIPTPLIAGTWNEIERLPNSVESGDCSRSVIRITMDVVVEDNTTSVQTFSRYDSEVVAGKLVLRNATITNITESGVMEMTYDDVTREYLILGTNYNDYLVLYSCQNSGSKSMISAWKYGRNTNYSDATAITTRTLVEAANIVNATWHAVSHSDTACKVTNGGVNLHISPVILLMVGLVLAKEF